MRPQLNGATFGGLVPNCDFYALAGDAEQILDFVFAQPGWVLYELASRHDLPLRQFGTTAAVVDAFDLSSRDAYFQLYASDMRGRVHEKRIVFTPGAVPGATFRYDSEGWGLIQLYFEAPHAGQLKPSHTNHNSEVRARRWEPTYADQPDRVDDWDWQGVARTSARLNRFIRKAALSKVGSRPILPAAHAACANGDLVVL